MRLQTRPARLLTALVIGASALLASGCSSIPLPFEINRIEPSEVDLDEGFAPVDEDDPMWQGDADDCLTANVDPNDPLVAETMALAMPEEQFWGLIDTLEGGTSETDYERLTDALMVLTVDELIAFDARLTLAMYALDDQCHLIHLRDHGTWDGGWVSADVFVYARADAVAAGRDAWQEAVDEGTITDRGEDSWGEYLLYVTEDAAVAQGMGEFELWDLERERFSLSFESGTNPTGWPGGENPFW